MNSILLENAGPVAHLEIPVQPGATILRGCSDIGKSETIKAVSRLAGGREDVTCKAGEAKGYVEGFGVRLGLGRVTRRTGTLEALAIEDGFGLGTLIDGDNLATAEAADRARIKALLRISGAKANLSRFHALLPGGKVAFERYVAVKAVETDDPVEMAGRIKRELESAARKLESEADTEEGKATAKRNAGDGLDLTAETDAAKLQQAHSQAVAHHARLQQQRDAAEDAQASAAEAREKLAEAGASSSGSMQEAQAALEAAKENRDVAVTAAREAKAEVTRLEAALKAAKAELGAALVAQQSADDTVTMAEHAVKLVEINGRMHAGWQEAIDRAAGVTGPQPEDVLKALDAVNQARKALEQAAVIRAAKEQVDQAAKHLERGKELRMEARSVRDAGKETDAVLSAMVASPNLTVSQGRLMTYVEGRGNVFFHERSDGTRTRIACMEKLHRVRQVNGNQLAIIPLAQRAWNDLAPSAKKELIGWAVENNCCLITAEVTDSPELTAESVTE